MFIRRITEVPGIQDTVKYYMNTGVKRSILKTTISSTVVIGKPVEMVWLTSSEILQLQ